MCKAREKSIQRHLAGLYGAVKQKHRKRAQRADSNAFSEKDAMDL